LEIVYQNTLGDVIRFNIYHQARLRTQQVSLTVFILLLGIIFWNLAGQMSFSFMAKLGFVVIWVTLCLGVWAVIALVMIFFSHSPKNNKGVITQHRIKLLEDNIVEETSVNTTTSAWSGIARVTQNRDYVMIYVSQHGAHIIPKKAFESNVAAQEFYEYAKQRWITATAPAP
jgi:hypothetical protein